MSEGMLYHYKGSMAKMTRETISQALAETETRLRTGKFTYTDQQVFQSQVKEIQTIWPEEVRNVMRQTAKDMTPTGQSVSPATIRQAMLTTYEKVICPKRAEIAQGKAEYEYRDATGDIVMSTLFRHAPNGEMQPMQAVRKYAEGGKLIKIKLSASPQRLVVNCDELEKSDGTERPGTADIYVQAYYSPTLKSAMLIGFAYKADIRAAAKGNRNTDGANCAWDKMAYHMPISKLRPMAEFLAQSGISEIPQGLLFENVPSPKELPVLARQDLQDMGKGESPENFDFLASCGIAKKQEAPTGPAQSGKKQPDKELEL